MGVKALVISDLHCRHSKIELIRKKEIAEPPNTWLFSDAMRVPSLKHPVQSLLDLIHEEKTISADILLCPGDITDKVDPQGLVTGWSMLEEIRRAINAKHIYLTLGNHDVDLYRIESNDAFEYVTKLKYNFPFADRNANSNYWLDNFCIIENDFVSLLIINSVYNYRHTQNCSKIEINQQILSGIERSIKNLKNPIRIAMLHHHPIQHRNIDYSDNDYLSNGDVLLRMLIQNDFTLVLHGHKHEPRCIDFNGIPILGSGSFSSRANLQETNGLNMFHIIEFENDGKHGSIENYTYHPTRGWKNDESSNFPIRFGFGANINILQTAKAINDWLGANRIKFYEEFSIDFPDLKYLLPHEIEKLEKQLRSKYAIEFNPNLNSRPKIISRQIIGK